MNYLIILLLCFMTLACDVLGSNQHEPEHALCEMEMEINGKSWKEMHPDDEVVWFRATSGIVTGRNVQSEEHDMLSIACERRYKSNYIESMRLRFAIPKGAQPEDLTPTHVDFLSTEVPRIERIRFSERDFDVIVGSYQRYDSTAVARAEITHIDPGNNRMTGVFEGKLVAREHDMNHPAHISIRRHPDTLHITGGRFEVEVEDLRRAYQP